jgi:methylenetetrahydrofolate dehydrogenase (NADP+)/methenyltetrahydrofolate cyclohydrolase
MPKILDGKAPRDIILNTLAGKISGLTKKPKLAIIQVGKIPESDTYIRQKKLMAEKIGALVEHITFEDTVTLKDVLSKITDLNADSSVHGIIVQLPLPAHLDPYVIIEMIDPRKDIDGLTSTNVKKLRENRSGGLVPATARGIVSLLKYHGIEMASKRVVVVGRSNLVGKPIAALMENQNATVTVCHRKTLHIEKETPRAEILIVAAGNPLLINENHVSKGQVVIDVGITVIPKRDSSGNVVGKELVGDVDFERVKNIVDAISPVPGGVGPMTVASLFENLMDAYEEIEA